MLQTYAAAERSGPRAEAAGWGGGRRPLVQWVGAAAERVLGEAGFNERFGGGLVRVEHCTSEYINAIYPSEITGRDLALVRQPHRAQVLPPPPPHPHATSPSEIADVLSPRLRSMLAEAGHIGRQFNPTVRRVFGPEFRKKMPRWSPDSGQPFLRYTLPAFELRRLLEEVRATGESFTLTYVKLPGGASDGCTWRGNATGPRVTLIEDGRGGRRCTETSAGTFAALLPSMACRGDEIALQPPPAPGVLKSIMLFFPLPIIPDVEQLPCMD